MTDNKKRDRPKTINPRSKQYRIRLTDDECEALKTIAKKHNLSVSKLIRSGIIEGEYQMTINEYQKAAYRTANQSLTDSQQLQNGLMGLNGESGECDERGKAESALSSWIRRRTQPAPFFW